MLWFLLVITRNDEQNYNSIKLIKNCPVLQFQSPAKWPLIVLTHAGHQKLIITLTGREFNKVKDLHCPTPIKKVSNNNNNND